MVRRNDRCEAEWVDIKLTHDSKHAIVSQKNQSRLMLVTRGHFCCRWFGIGMVLLSTACRPSSTDHPPGYLTVAIESNPLQLDPRYATDANSVRIGNLIYNSLLRADQKSQLQLELAEHWRMVDEKTYLFALRKDVRFHDGRPAHRRRCEVHLRFNFGP